VCEKRALNIMETERPRKGWGGGKEQEARMRVVMGLRTTRGRC
jgi:hypothetical protein